MLRIKLERRGKSTQPSFRIRVKEKKLKKFVADIGFWNPIKKLLSLNYEDYYKWISHGAKATSSVKRIINSFSTEQVKQEI